MDSVFAVKSELLDKLSEFGQQFGVITGNVAFQQKDNGLLEFAFDASCELGHKRGALSFDPYKREQVERAIGYIRSFLIDWTKQAI